MKRLLSLVFALFIITAVNAQENNTKSKLTRKEKKELQKKQEIQDERMLADIIENRRFVLEATVMYDKYGQQIRVNRMINFVAVDSTSAAFQFGSASSVGVNGLGGVTIDGNITKYDVKTTYTGSAPLYKIEIFIMSRNDVITIQFDITSLRNARAVVKNSRGDRLVYAGEIVIPEKSRVVKGFYAH